MKDTMTEKGRVPYKEYNKKQLAELNNDTDAAAEKLMVRRGNVIREG